MGVPAEVRAVPRPKNTIVVFVNIKMEIIIFGIPEFYRNSIVS